MKDLVDEINEFVQSIVNPNPSEIYMHPEIYEQLCEEHKITLPDGTKERSELTFVATNAGDLEIKVDINIKRFSIK